MAEIGKATLNKIADRLDKELKKGKTLQIEYNRKADDFKVLVADMHRMK